MDVLTHVCSSSLLLQFCHFHPKHLAVTHVHCSDFWSSDPFTVWPPADGMHAFHTSLKNVRCSMASLHNMYSLLHSMTCNVLSQTLMKQAWILRIIGYLKPFLNILTYCKFCFTYRTRLARRFCHTTEVTGHVAGKVGTFDLPCTCQQCHRRYSGTENWQPSSQHVLLCLALVDSAPETSA